MISILRTDAILALVFLRLGLASVFFAHGAQQLLGWFGGKGPRDAISAWKERYGIPRPIGALGIFTEFFGSFAMLLGLLTRPFALGLAIFMTVAMWKAHWKHGFFLAHRGGGNGIEFCLALFLMAVALLVGGGGAFSLDLLLSR